MKGNPVHEFGFSGVHLCAIRSPCKCSCSFLASEIWLKLWRTSKLKNLNCIMKWLSSTTFKPHGSLPNIKKPDIRRRGWIKAHCQAEKHSTWESVDGKTIDFALLKSRFGNLKKPIIGKRRHKDMSAVCHKSHDVEAETHRKHKELSGKTSHMEN